VIAATLPQPQVLFLAELGCFLLALLVEQRSCRGGAVLSLCQLAPSRSRCQCS